MSHNELFSMYVGARTYTDLLQQRVNCLEKPTGDDLIAELRHHALVLQLNTQLEAAHRIQASWEQMPQLQQEITCLLAPLSAAITHQARLPERADYEQAVEAAVTTTYATEVEDEMPASERHILTHIAVQRQCAQQEYTILASLPPEPSLATPTTEDATAPANTLEDAPEEADAPPTLSAAATAILAMAKTGREFTAQDVRRLLLEQNVMTEAEWQGRHPSFFQRVQEEIVTYLRSQGIESDWDSKGNSRAKAHSLFISKESSDTEALAALFSPTPQKSDTPESARSIRAIAQQLIELAVSPTDEASLGVALVARGILTREQWHNRPPHLARILLVALATQPRPPTHAPQPRVVQASDRPQRPLDTRATPASPAEPVPTPTLTVTVEPQRELTPTPDAEPDEKVQKTPISRQPERAPLGDLARTILRQTRAMINPGLDGSRRRRSIESVMETLQLNHPAVDVQAILDELIDCGELHTVEIDGERRLLPGAKHKITTTREGIPIVHLQPPSFHEASRMKRIDHLQENPDIVDAVRAHIAEANGDSRAHMLTEIHKAVGSELDRRDFFFLLQQMEDAGIITRGRIGTDGPYVAHLVARNQ